MFPPHVRVLHECGSPTIKKQIRSSAEGIKVKLRHTHTHTLGGSVLALQVFAGLTSGRSSSSGGQRLAPFPSQIRAD